MKKNLVLFLLFCLNFGCSDGNVEVENIDFATATAVSCGDIIYYISGNEMMVVKIDAINNPFENKITALNVPKTLTIGSGVVVSYRKYNGAPTGGNVCTALPNATPSVVEEWKAIGGTIEITTTAQYSSPDANNATKLEGFNHAIEIKNLKFAKPVGEQLYDSFKLGKHFTTNTLAYPFGTPPTISFCNTAAIPISIASISVKESIVIKNLSPNLFVNAPLPIVRTANLSLAGNNVLTYNVYNGILPVGFYCSTATSPTLINNWINTNVTTGTIEVITSVTGAIATHKIHLKNVVLKYSTAEGTISFNLGDDYYLGDYTN